MDALVQHGDAKSGASAGYDKMRLLECKNSSEYVISKRQLLSAKAARQNDKAILACARGADGLPAAAELPVQRLLALLYFSRKSFRNKVPIHKSAFLSVSIEKSSKKKWQ